LAEVPTVVEKARSLSGNQLVVTSAGEFRINGCDNAITVYPSTTHPKL
jgi:hypothetical protein